MANTDTTKYIDSVSLKNEKYYLRDSFIEGITRLLVAKMDLEDSSNNSYQTSISAPGVVEFADNTATVSYTANLLANGKKPTDASYKNLSISCGNTATTGKDTANSNTVSGSVAVNGPQAVTFTASGSGKYSNYTQTFGSSDGIDVTFAQSSATTYVVMPSYIGYVSANDDTTLKTMLDNASGSFTKTKLVKHTLNGSYNLTFDFADSAYMFVAVPVNAQVNDISKIVQHGTLDANQPFDTKTIKATGWDYKVFICKTKHNKGTYNFILS